MASLPPGIYTISSALNKDIFLVPGPVPRIFPPPDVVVKGISQAFHPRWHVESSGDPGSNLSKVFLEGFTGYGLWVNLKDRTLYISTKNTSEFSIESTGPGTWRFHIPNENLVVKLDTDGKPVKVVPEDGTPNTSWSFEVAQDAA